jgi:hypothetical protein
MRVSTPLSASAIRTEDMSRFRSTVLIVEQALTDEFGEVLLSVPLPIDDNHGAVDDDVADPHMRQATA